MKRFAMVENGVVTRADVAAVIPNGGVEVPPGVRLDRLVGGKYANGEFTELTDLEAAKRAAVTAVADFTENARRRIAGNPAMLEVAAWADKAARARRVIAAGAAADKGDVAVLAAEATARGMGETAQQLAATQVAKADRLSAAVATVDGMAKAAKAAVATAEDDAALTAVLAQLRTAGDAKLAELLAG